MNCLIQFRGKKDNEKVFKSWIVLLLLAGGVLAGCSGDRTADKKHDGKITIVTSTGIIADIIKNVGGEHVHVEGLMGLGVDPHLYKATQGDIKVLEDEKYQHRKLQNANI